jgi:hypothetical protein
LTCAGMTQSRSRDIPGLRSCLESIAPSFSFQKHAPGSASNLYRSTLNIPCCWMEGNRGVWGQSTFSSFHSPDACILLAVFEVLFSLN